MEQSGTRDTFHVQKLPLQRKCEGILGCEIPGCGEVAVSVSDVGVLEVRPGQGRGIRSASRDTLTARFPP